jgi:hypothetical protein
MPLPRTHPRGPLRSALRPLLIALAGMLLVLVPTACDFPGPAVTVAFTSHTDGQRIIGSRTVTVSGVLHGATPSAFSLTLNGTAVPIALPTSGTFAASVTLGKDGTNTLVASATASGETSTATLHLDYPFLSFSNGEAAALVMGQTSFTASLPSATPSTMSAPAGAPALVDGKLYLPDTGNHRVVGYGSVPTSSGALFSILLGQTLWTDNTAEPISATSLASPAGVAASGGDLIVADTGYNRVLIYNGAPTLTHALAAVAVGQSGLYANHASCVANGLRAPRAAFVVDGELIVADTGNHRVLIWNSVPTANGTPADLVLGQTDLVSCTANAGGTRSAASLASPSDVWSDGTRLVVADTGNHRVLLWKTFPTADDQPADLVLGQATMTAATPAGAATGLSSPSSVTSNGNQLFVADTGNHRVLIWNGFPTANHEAADRVLGQADLTHTAPNRGAGTAADSLSGPQGVQVYDGMLLVADTGNSRALIFRP